MDQEPKRQALSSASDTVQQHVRPQIADRSPVLASGVTVDELDGPSVEKLEQQLQEEALELDRQEVEEQGVEPLERPPIDATDSLADSPAGSPAGSTGGSHADSEEEGETYFQGIIAEMEEILNSDKIETHGMVTIDPQTAKQITSDLQVGGPVGFMSKYLLIGGDRQVSLAEILCALGFPLKADKAASYPDSRLEIMVQIAMREYLRKRHRLDEPRTLDDLVKAINSANNIIVVSGAGISTSLGIPDFRSDDGLYSQLKHLGLTDPQEVFDIKLFRQDPSIFYSVAKKILPAEKRFTPTHQFIRLLQDKGKLLRNYTQNIDNLEIEAGIEPEKLVQCHGSFGIAYCFSCFRKVNGTTLYPQILAGEVPRCEPCTAKAKKLEAQEHELPDSFGVFKPEITFFGESLPDRFDDLLFKGGDAKNCDLLICIGTSLKVMPVSGIVKVVDRQVPQIYISKTPCKHYEFEVSMLGPCDDIVELLCQKLGWNLVHEMNKRPQGMNETEYPGGEIAYNDGVYMFQGEGGCESGGTTPGSTESSSGPTSPEDLVPNPMDPMDPMDPSTMGPQIQDF